MFLGQNFRVTVSDQIPGEDAVTAAFPVEGLIGKAMETLGLAPEVHLTEERLRRLSKEGRALDGMSEFFNEARLAIIREKAHQGLIFGGKCRKSPPQVYVRPRKLSYEISTEELLLDGGDLLSIDLAQLESAHIGFLLEEGKLSQEAFTQEVKRSLIDGLRSQQEDLERPVELIMLAKSAFPDFDEKALFESVKSGMEATLEQ